LELRQLTGKFLNMDTVSGDDGTAAPENARRRRIGHPKGRQVDAAALDQVRSLLGNSPRRRDMLIEYLHLINDTYGHLSAAHLAALAKEMSCSQAEVYEVASFYHHFKIIKEQEEADKKPLLRICDGIACEMAGAKELAEELEYNLSDAVTLEKVPCVGACNCAPVAVYGRRQIPEASVKEVGVALEKQDFDARVPDYQNLESYRQEGGYEKLSACLAGQAPREEVVAEIEKSGLRGMGGAGFPVFRKWQFLEGSPKPRAMVVNADEGEPGTFKDRHCFETSPHKVIEGMLIAAWMVEAVDTYIYLRDEYPQVHDILRAEIAAVEAAGLNGDIRIHLRRGAGAYICGEESALLESIEGNRGLPRNRPPYPAQKGLFGRPTLINNVETLYWVSDILNKGADWYQGGGRPRYYSVSGRVKEPKVVLAPSGITANELINDHCGGMADGHTFKAYLPGGASGGILPASMADLALDFGVLEEHGCFVGSAAVVIFSDQDSIADVTKNLLHFFVDESCGQCTPCRLGCEKMLALLDADQLDEALIGDLSEVMRDASICGLGQAAPNPVASALKHFREDLG